MIHPSESERAIEADALERFFRDISVSVDGEAPSLAALSTFFDGVGAAVRAEAKCRLAAERVEANRFNVLDLLQPDENGLSDLIADLISPVGRHGQGDAFLRCFLAALGLGPMLTTAPVRVLREVPTHGIELFRRRIDIVVETDALILIENKVDAAEQHDQIKDYLRHLDYCSRAFGRVGRLVFLTPNGRRPVSAAAGQPLDERVICWSYEYDLRRWLERCREVCQADKIRHFLGDFVTYIDTRLKRETIADDLEQEDEQ